MSDQKWHVLVEYPGDKYDAAVDERIIGCMDRNPDFTGCGLREGATRDLGWCCNNRTQAEAIADVIEDGYEGWPPITIHIKNQDAHPDQQRGAS